MGHMVRQRLALTIIGLAISLVATTMTLRGVQGLLCGLTPLDPTTFVAAFLWFASVAPIAAHVPACRATSIDPLVALHYEEAKALGAGPRGRIPLQSVELSRDTRAA
jgi:hypothetical protein